MKLKRLSFDSSAFSFVQNLISLKFLDVYHFRIHFNFALTLSTAELLKEMKREMWKENCVSRL